MTTASNDKISCSVCGSSNAVQSLGERYLSIPYGQPTLIHESSVSCPDCGAEIDTTKDEDIQLAIESSRHDSIKTMLDYLIKEGYSLAQIERALDLPQRTISNWKESGELSSIGIVLLRILRTYPWIIDVAEHKYDYTFATGGICGQSPGLTPKVIICSVCGKGWELNSKEQPPCEHLKLFQTDCKSIDDKSKKMIVKTADGKYTFIFDENSGSFECLRYGKKWRDLTGDNAVLSLVQEITDARLKKRKKKIYDQKISQ